MNRAQELQKTPGEEMKDRNGHAMPKVLMCVSAHEGGTAIQGFCESHCFSLRIPRKGLCMKLFKYNKPESQRNNMKSPVPKHQAVNMKTQNSIIEIRQGPGQK